MIMQRFVVRVGYDYVMFIFRDVNVTAVDCNAAASQALALAESDPTFWQGATECDGEARATEVLQVDEDVEP